MSTEPINPFKMLATMSEYLGRSITPRLGIEESIASVHIGEDKCWYIVRRARVSMRKRGYIVTDRGVTTVLFKRGTGNVWQRDEVTVWGMLEAPEHRSTWAGLTPAEHAERTEWEQLCHRPGTDKSPMDNAGRKAQGYNY